MKKIALIITLPLLIAGCSLKIDSSSSTRSSSTINEQFLRPDLSNLTKINLAQNHIDKIDDFTHLTIPHILEDGKNVIYSPTSYMLALSMLCEQASNELHQELLETLNFDSNEELRLFAKDLFASSYLNGDSKLHLANSTWTHDSFEPNREMINHLIDDYYSSYYHGNLKERSASELLDEWLRDVTEDLIHLDSIDDSPFLKHDVLLAMFSSIFASSNWAKSVTQTNLSFNSAVVDALKMSSIMAYNINEDYEGCHIPLNDGFSLLVIEPLNGIGNFITNPNNLKYALDINNYRLQSVDIKFPTFEIANNIDLMAVSKEIGLTHIDGLNQLNNLVENNEDLGQVVGAIYQDGKIIVDKNGIKAAAVTTIREDATSVGPDNNIEFDVDQQFIYAFVYRNVPHFIGTVYEL